MAPRFFGSLSSLKGLPPVPLSPYCRNYSFFFALIQPLPDPFKSRVFFPPPRRFLPPPFRRLMSVFLSDPPPTAWGFLPWSYLAFLLYLWVIKSIAIVFFRKRLRRLSYMFSSPSAPPHHGTWSQRPILFGHVEFACAFAVFR